MRGDVIYYNHINMNYLITVKKNLFQSIKSYLSHIQKIQVLSKMIPLTFIVRVGVENDDMINFLKVFQRIKFNKTVKSQQKNIWIVKPENFNQGKGIQLFSNQNDIISFLNRKQPGTYWIIQKYIENPYLYLNRKFDI